ncbi:MAG: SoxR reducing system RseC family protein [Myxococcota bacterium]|nr:SoxR reducing system RseC family protein [Myxococcota bacterium]
MHLNCTEIALVTGIAPDGRAIVKIRRAEACHACAAKGACEALGGKTRDLELAVENTVNAKPGDAVVISMSEGSVIRASAVLYLLPALGLVTGAVVGWDQAEPLGMGSDPASMIGALGGLGLGLFLTRILSKKMSRSKRYMPRLTGIQTRSGE